MEEDEVGDGDVPVVVVVVKAAADVVSLDAGGTSDSVTSVVVMGIGMSVLAIAPIEAVDVADFGRVVSRGTGATHSVTVKVTRPPLSVSVINTVCVLQR